MRHTTELEEPDKISLAFQVMDLKGPALRSWTDGAAKLAAERRRRGGVTQAGAGVGDHGRVAHPHPPGAGAEQMAEQEFMQWAMDSGRLSEAKARQILEDAIRKGQLPPFEEAKNIVRARRSEILEAERQTEARREQERDLERQRSLQGAHLQQGRHYDGPSGGASGVDARRR